MGGCGSVLGNLFGGFSSNYELGTKLGKGGFGTVYKCICKETREEFAVKRIKFDKDETSETSEAHHEERIFWRLGNDCANIVLCYGGITEFRWRYILFELVEGEELFNAIGRRIWYTERTAIRFMYQILNAIEYCHSRNIMHRDLKSKNIMLRTQDDCIKIIDFGLAGKTDGNTARFEKNVGTLPYMAPEILKGKPHGKPVDIWACGALYYNLLSGIHPFHPFPSNDIAILRKLIMNCHFVYPPHEFRGITQDSINLISSMMRLRQHNRPPANVVRTELRRLRDRVNIIYPNRRTTIDRLRRWDVRIPTPTVLPYATQKGVQTYVPYTGCCCSAAYLRQVPKPTQHQIPSNSTISI